MSRRAYSEINLHFVWHVKSNVPIINETIELGLYRFIRNYALKTKGLIFDEVGGIETHVHIAVTIPPTLLISEWIGQVKGSSSHYVNHELANLDGTVLIVWIVKAGILTEGALQGMAKTLENGKYQDDIDIDISEIVGWREVAGKKRFFTSESLAELWLERLFAHGFPKNP